MTPLERAAKVLIPTERAYDGVARNGTVTKTTPTKRLNHLTVKRLNTATARQCQSYRIRDLLLSLRHNMTINLNRSRNRLMPQLGLQAIKKRLAPLWPNSKRQGSK